MKKRFIRYNFNMVEIMLAVIVIALGIAGTFALFPVGVNANKDATAENSIADIAEYVTAFVRAECLRLASNSASGNNEGAFTEGKVGEVFGEPGIPPSLSNPIVDVIGSAWRAPDHNNSGDVNTKTLLVHDSVPGAYLVRQMSGPVGNQFADFTAVARVYLDGGNDLDNNAAFDEEYFFRDRRTPERYGSTKSNVDIFKFLLPAVLELSWPASLPYAEREKRYFRFEIFNTLYEQSKDTPAGGGA